MRVPKEILNQMGYIKDPEGIDLVVGPSILTAEDKMMISEIIADYKKTGSKTLNKLTDSEVQYKPISRIRKKKVLA
jgi:hypothetical protein